MNEKQDTKSRILDSAEKLFGLNGFEATSLRDITAEAQVNLAAVNYHFQTKDSLIDAVIARRIEPVNEKRRSMLNEAGPNPTVEQILIAFLAPILFEDVKQIAPLMGRIMATPDGFITRLFKRHIEEMVRLFSDALAVALPDLCRADIAWRLHFTAGAMANILTRGYLLPDLSNGLCDPSDRPAVLARLVTFAAAG